MLDRSAEAYREDRFHPKSREMASFHSLSLLASQDLPSPLELFSLDLLSLWDMLVMFN